MKTNDIVYYYDTMCNMFARATVDIVYPDGKIFCWRDTFVKEDGTIIKKSNITVMLALDKDNFSSDLDVVVQKQHQLEREKADEYMKHINSIEDLICFPVVFNVCSINNTKNWDPAAQQAYILKAIELLRLPMNTFDGKKYLELYEACQHE